MTIYEKIVKIIAEVKSPEMAAKAILGVLKESSDVTWYCERFGMANYDPDICKRYKHKGCGYRILGDLNG